MAKSEITDLWREIKKSSNPFKGLLKIILENSGGGHGKMQKQLDRHKEFIQKLNANVKKLQAQVEALQKKVK